jgi:hypothetical protein
MGSSATRRRRPSESVEIATSGAFRSWIRLKYFRLKLWEYFGDFAEQIVPVAANDGRRSDVALVVGHRAVAEGVIGLLGIAGSFASAERPPSRRWRNAKSQNSEPFA